MLGIEDTIADLLVCRGSRHYLSEAQYCAMNVIAKEGQGDVGGDSREA